MPDNIRLIPNVGVDPEVILSKARNWELEDVLVIGWGKDGEFIAGGSMTSLKEIAWLLRNADNWVENLIQDA